MSLVRSRTSGRRYSNRSGSRSLLTRRSASRTYAKKKLEWTVPFSATCGRYCATPGDACPNGGSIILMSNQELIDKFEDTTRIVRIEGDLWFQPTIPNSSGCMALTQNVGQTFTTFRMGLKKSQVVQRGAGIPQALNPLDAGANPEALSDYADGKWLKLWPLWLYQPTLIMGWQSQPSSCCSFTTRPEYVVPPTVAGANPGYVVPAETTECIPCPTSEVEVCNIQSVIPAAKHFPVRINRPIRLNGDNALTIFFGWETLELCGDTTRRTQVDMQFHGQIRMLIEK